MKNALSKKRERLRPLFPSTSIATSESIPPTI
jgi:hypothetical protein